MVCIFFWSTDFRYLIIYPQKSRRFFSLYLVSWVWLGLDIEPYFLLRCILLLSTCLSFYSQFNFLLKGFCVFFLHIFNLLIFTLPCSHAFLTSHPHLALFIFSWPRYTKCGILVPQLGIEPAPLALEVQPLDRRGSLSPTLWFTHFCLILMLVSSCSMCQLTIRNSSHLSHGLHLSSGTHNPWEVSLPLLLASLAW